MKFYQLVLTQLFNNEKQINVFHYRTADAEVSAANCAAAFVEDILPKINDLQNVAVTNSLIRVTELEDLVDFYESAVTGAGANTSSEALPPHNVINFTLRLNTRAVRPGSKRFTGIPESAQAGGLINVASYITQLNTLRTALATPIVLASSPLRVYTPVVIKRVRTEETVDDKVVVRYSMPTTDASVVYGDVVTALVNLRISHQTSKGNGR